MKPLYTLALLVLLAILPEKAFGEGRTDAPDGFYVGTDAAPSYTLHVFPPNGESSSGVTFHIRQSSAFLPQHVVVVSATNQIPGGYLVQVSGRGTEKMLDLSGIIIVENHNGYFGDGKRVGSSATVSLLLNDRDKAERVASMIRTRYSLPLTELVIPTTETPSDQHTNEIDNWRWDQAKADALLYKANHDTDYQESKDAALAYSAMVYERKLHDPEFASHPPPSEWPFPNFQAGPGRPQPIEVNFYGVNDRYPLYLLCEYEVEEGHYRQTNEREWFKAALGQIRRSGPGKFPPIKWIAIAIRNRAEHTDAGTFENSFKVGAVFNAAKVFDSSTDLLELIAHADLDRHPFVYDLQQPTPGEQQRWVIVERHAVTNQITNSGR